MLKRTTIDQVNDLPLDQVIGKYTELTRKGSGFESKSPFTDEKTASFSISLSKNIWKCFSTGKGGVSAIGFVMDLKSLTYIEAVKEIADANGIILEYDDSEEAKKYIDRTLKVNSIHEINSEALDFWIEQNKSTPKDKIRASKEMYEAFSLGFALDDWNALSNHLVSKGHSKESLVGAGLANRNDKGGIYDVFRGRVMFPIFSPVGKLIGFSGRDVTDADKSKYSNTKDSTVYSKSNSLFGIYQAKESIVRMKGANLVEGNYGVTSFHNQDLTNTVARLGSALTPEQAKMIRKYTDMVTIVIDNDKAGKGVIEKDTITLLKEGFNVMLFVPEEEGMDPDDLVNSKAWEPGEFMAYFAENSVEAVDFLAKQYFEKAGTTIEKTNAEWSLTKLLTQIAHPPLRNAYVLKYVKEYKINKAEVEKNISIQLATSKVSTETKVDGTALPSYLKEDDMNDFKNFGFYIDKTKDKIGYYFPVNSSSERVSNFIINPLFQVYSGMNDSRRILELVNERNRDKPIIIEVTNKGFVSNMIFEELVQNQGNFWFNGTKRHFQKLKVKLLPQFPFCREIRTLGWQSRGFFSFADGIISEDGQFKKVDSYGICHYAEEKFFLPAFSKLFNDIEEEDDQYESDRHFVFRPSKVSFNEWATKMKNVHLQNGVWAVLFFCATLFRDLIFGELSYFPHLFLFGQVQTGKSTCANSLNTIFFGSQPPFNLSIGTQVSFQRKIARTKNSCVWFDEFTNEIDEVRFQSLKGAYDGAGHEKGIMSNDNKTKTTKVNGGLVISGQYLPTRDDNSLNTRSIVLTFDRKAEDVTIEEVQAFNQLKSLEKKGLSNLIVEAVKYRDLVEEKFNEVRSEIEATLKNDLHGYDYKGRIMNNYVVLLTLFKILEGPLNIPFGYEATYKNAITNIIDQSEAVADSDALMSYWKMIDFMAAQHQINEGEDYIVKTEYSIKIRTGREGSEMVNFNSGKKVLFLRFTKIHPLYMQAHRQQFGQNGVPDQSIKAYMKGAKSFLGIVKSVSFNGSNTSGYAFDYDMLNVNLKVAPEAKPIPDDKKKGKEGKQDDLPF